MRAVNLPPSPSIPRRSRVRTSLRYTLTNRPTQLLEKEACLALRLSV